MKDDNSNILKTLLSPGAPITVNKQDMAKTSEVIKSNESSIWDVEPEKIIKDNMPTEETLNVQQAHNTLEDLLLPSSIIIDRITKYLEENDIKYVSHNDKRTEQTFTIEGK